ncbi:hypothetical protein PG989_015018 [Apiospora arundinis]
MELEGSTWNTRGWTFQERILSRRIIHFTKSLIFLECWSGDWSEDNRVPGDLLINRMPWLGGSSGSGQYSEDPKAVLHSWYYIVEAYTLRSLTMERDKLLALGGVMERVSGITGFTNVAGIWKEDIADGLLWFLSGDKLERRRLKHPQGPSWSWASWNGPVSCRPCFYAFGREISELGDRGLVAFPISHYGTEDTGTYEALVLTPIPGKELQFRRSGLLTVRNDTPRTGPLETFLGGLLTFPPTPNNVEFTII